MFEKPPSQEEETTKYLIDKLARELVSIPPYLVEALQGLTPTQALLLIDKHGAAIPRIVDDPGNAELNEITAAAAALTDVEKMVAHGAGLAAEEYAMIKLKQAKSR